MRPPFQSALPIVKKEKKKKNKITTNEKKGGGKKSLRDILLKKDLFGGIWTLDSYP